MYTLLRQIGAGSFGHVFKAVDNDGNCCAVKVEPATLAIRPLKHEARVYKKLKGCVGIPPMRDYFHTPTDTILVLDLLGHNLGMYFDFQLQKLSLKCVARVAQLMLQVLEGMHEKGYVHRDIKPGNILFDEKTGSEMFVIDLGMAKSYIDEKTGEHKAMEQRPGLNGTARYASINAHQGRGQSRRVDLESLGYMLVYLATGSVPWQGLKNSETKNDDIAAVKINTPIPEFCSGFPAAEAIAEHLTYARGLEYEERPDYPFLFGLYTSILEQYGVIDDGKWDWHSRPDDSVMAGDKSQWKLRRSSDPILNENSGTAEGDNRSSINVQRNNPENLTERPTQRDKGGSCQCIIS